MLISSLQKHYSSLFFREVFIAMELSRSNFSAEEAVIEMKKACKSSNTRESYDRCLKRVGSYVLEQANQLHAVGDDHGAEELRRLVVNGRLTPVIAGQNTLSIDLERVKACKSNSCRILFALISMGVDDSRPWPTIDLPFMELSKVQWRNYLWKLRKI